jgi:hypothetical protein
MIPDFKTYIGESIWRNISQRSEGIKSRKEDSFNNMDIGEFYNYLKDNYRLIDFEEFYWITADENGEPEYEIWIPIMYPKNSKAGSHLYFIVYQYYDKYLTISNNFSIDYPELSKLIDDNFVMREHLKYNDNLLYIGEKGKITYSFVIKVIDFIIDNAQDENEIIIDKK